MNLKGRLVGSIQPLVMRAPPGGKSGVHPVAVGEVDWNGWLRQIERKRRLLTRISLPADPARFQFPTTLLGRLTAASFQLDGLMVTESHVHAAETATPVRRPFRSRLGRCLRNHLAILHGIRRLLASCQALKVSAVVRWYTSISSGLCTAALDASTMLRIETVVGWISSPRLRLQPAVQDVARLHAQLMSDPLVPSFNGILSRLLLCYHLGRCGLPPVLFDPGSDRELLTQEGRLLPRMMDLIDASYSLILLGRVPDGAALSP